jgi:putative oxidoreductase
MTATAVPAPRPAATYVDLGLLILRLVAGLIFAMHGGQKLFVFGLGGVTGAFAQMGAPLPAVTGPLVAFVETFGGLALVVGLLTRLAGLGLAIDMLGAILIVHLKNGFFLPTGIEFVLLLMAAALTLAAAGAGRYSLDALIAARRGR